MKVLSINHLLDPHSGGGTAERTFQLARFFARIALDTTVVTLDVGIDQARRDAVPGVQIVALPCMNLRYFLPRVAPAAIDRLVAQADIVHLSGHWTVLNALVFRSCRRQGKPFVFCPAGALKSFGRSRGIKRLYDALAGRAIARSAAACIAITDQESADFHAYGVRQERVSIIPNGIDPDQYRDGALPDAQAAWRERFSLGTAPFILFLGRLNEIKGPDLLLEAFVNVADKFPSTNLVFAGPDGGMQASLLATAMQRGVGNRVHFTGYLGGADKTAALHAASLLVIPSRHEAMSIVVLEAGICGTPVLFTNTCGLDSLAEAGAGTKVEVSASSIGEAMTVLLSDVAMAHRSAQTLQALVKKNYTWQIQAERYKLLFECLLGQGRT